MKQIVFNSFLSQMSLSGRIWDDRHDGHIPRPKDDVRLAIEQSVASLPIIQELDREYEIFIEKYQTKINERLI